MIGGRYGLSSKDFSPAMVKGIFDELKKDRPQNHFSIGINDDVNGTSLAYDPDWTILGDEVKQCLFYGLGADGTVGANHNTIRIIGDEAKMYAQGYFVYDSKKSGGRTTSHLRFGPEPINAPYLIGKANFLGVHQFQFFSQFDVLGPAANGATVLVNSPYPADQAWDKLPASVQKQMIDKKLKVYVVDAYNVARAAGMGNRINTIMQTCFFSIAKVIPPELAIKSIKDHLQELHQEGRGRRCKEQRRRRSGHREHAPDGRQGHGDRDGRLQLHAAGRRAGVRQDLHTCAHRGPRRIAARLDDVGGRLVPDRDFAV